MGRSKSKRTGALPKRYQQALMHVYITLYRNVLDSLLDHIEVQLSPPNALALNTFISKFQYGTIHLSFPNDLYFQTNFSQSSTVPFNFFYRLPGSSGDEIRPRCTAKSPWNKPMIMESEIPRGNHEPTQNRDHSQDEYPKQETQSLQQNEGSCHQWRPPKASRPFPAPPIS